MNVPKMDPSVEYANGMDNRPAPIIVLIKLIEEDTVEAPLPITGSTDGIFDGKQQQETTKE